MIYRIKYLDLLTKFNLKIKQRFHKSQNSKLITKEALRIKQVKYKKLDCNYYKTELKIKLGAIKRKNLNHPS